MNLAARPWIIAVFLGFLALSPTSAHAAMTPQEVQEFNEEKTLAEKGDAVAQFNLGICYNKGEGVEKDYVKAVYWYRKSAEQGYDKAQFNLGVHYSKGEGVAKDYVQEVYWYRKAAEQGSTEAQSNIGLCYAIGEGVAKDYEQAVFWSRKAAEQGSAEAQCNLGSRFHNGQGVAKDDVEAYAYYNLSGITYDTARKNLAIIEKNMSRDEIAAGQKRTKELQKEIEEKIAAKKARK